MSDCKGKESYSNNTILLSISKWVTQKARSLHKVVPSRYTHTITTTKAILYNIHTSILTHIQLQQKIIFTTCIHNTLYICTYTHTITTSTIKGNYNRKMPITLLCRKGSYPFSLATNCNANLVSLLCHWFLHVIFK